MSTFTQILSINPNTGIPEDVRPGDSLSLILAGFFIETSSPYKIQVPDDTPLAFQLRTTADPYIVLDTTTGSENLSFGNSTTNPDYDFLGTGKVTIYGDCEVKGTLTVGAISWSSLELTGYLIVHGDTTFGDSLTQRVTIMGALDQPNLVFRAGGGPYTIKTQDTAGTSDNLTLKTGNGVTSGDLTLDVGVGSTTPGSVSIGGNSSLVALKSPGGIAVNLDVLSGVALSQGDVLTFTDLGVVKADASRMGELVCGVAATTIGSGTTCNGKVINFGYAQVKVESGHPAITKGSKLFLSTSTPGTVTATPPSSGTVHLIGKAAANWTSGLAPVILYLQFLYSEG